MLVRRALFVFCKHCAEQICDLIELEEDGIRISLTLVDTPGQSRLRVLPWYCEPDLNSPRFWRQH